MANSRSKIEEIQRQLESELNRLLEANRKLTTREGVVTEFADGVARVSGLSDMKMKVGDTLTLVESTIRAKTEDENEPEIIAVVVDLDEDDIGCIVFGEERFVKAGDTVTVGERRFVKRNKTFTMEEAVSASSTLSMPVGEGMLGRVLDPLGRPLDNPDKRPEKVLDLPLERKAIGVIFREKIIEALHTGISSVDSMIPIGRGQRMLVIGDRGTGKTALAIDTIIHQNQLNHLLNGHETEFRKYHPDTVFCIYVAIGHKASEVNQIRAIMEKHHALQYTAIVAAMANDPASLLFIAPFAGCTLGEYFRDSGKHALVVYDDLTRHAAAYRQVSLLLRRPPGREAYPGDIFYLHSRLLERSCKVSHKGVEEAIKAGRFSPDGLNPELKNLFKPYYDKNLQGLLHGGGSLTAIPVVETKQSDYSAYIPTNIISITDGQIYLEPKLFNEGVRPAVNVGLSVSRVGRDAQTEPMKNVSGNLRVNLANLREKEKYAKFGFEDEQTLRELKQGRCLVQLFKQGTYPEAREEQELRNPAAQVAGIFLGTQGYLVDFHDDAARVHEFVKRFWKSLPENTRTTLRQNKTALDNITMSTLHDCAKRIQSELARS
jgi:F-type H+-transporting ATPase subunit alpha